MKYKERIAKLLDAAALGGEEDIGNQIGAEAELEFRLAAVDSLIEQGQRQIEKDLREIRKILALKMASIREMDAAVEALLERRRQIEAEEKSGARSHKAGEQRAPKPR